MKSGLKTLGMWLIIGVIFIVLLTTIMDNSNSKMNYSELVTKIEAGEVTQDGKFSIDDVRCVGACGLAPVFMVNDEVYGNATVKQFDEVIDKYMKE